MLTDNPALAILRAMWKIGADRDKTFYLGSNERKFVEYMINSFYPGVLSDPEEQEDNNGWQE